MVYVATTKIPMNFMANVETVPFKIMDRTHNINIFIVLKIVQVMEIYLS